MAKLADTLTSRDAVRRATIDDIVTRAELESTAMEGGPLDGIQVVSIGKLREIQVAALQVELPPPSELYAEVTTPANIAVSAVCPECREVTEIVVKLGPRLTVEGNTTELAVKAKSKAVVHMHGQMSLPPVEGQISVDEAVGEIDDLRIRILRAADEENGARVALRAAVDAAKLARAALAAAWMIVTTTEDLEALTTAGPLQGIERAAAEAIGKPVTVELDPTPVVRLPAKPRRPMPGSTKAEQAREKAERAERVMAAMGRLGDDQRAVAAELGMRTNAVAMVVKHARVRAAQAGAAAT